MTDEKTEPETAVRGAVSDSERPETESGTGDTPSRSERRDERVRERLKATESERDSLRAALEPHIRREVERLAAEKLADGSSVWLLGDDVTGYLSDGHAVDADRVADAVDALLERAPALAARKFAGSADGGARQTAPTKTAGWSDLIGSAEKSA